MKDLGLNYLDAMHGVQSAVAYELSSGKSTDATPKQLRVGVNSCMIDSAALALCLMNAGVIKEADYMEALRLMANNELAMYESKHHPTKFR